MAHRTYIVGLRLVLGAAKRYIDHWGIPLATNLTPEQVTCVTSTIQAINDCLAAIPEPPLNP